MIVFGSLLSTKVCLFWGNSKITQSGDKLVLCRKSKVLFDTQPTFYRLLSAFQISNEHENDTAGASDDPCDVHGQSQSHIWSQMLSL